jgi:rod shape-determining protein MreC
MRHLPVEPPAFFPRGPSPLARLTVVGLVSIGLLFVDTRYHYLEGIRVAAVTILYPLQFAAQLPGQALLQMGGYFVTKRSLAEENAMLKQQLVEKSAPAQGYAA